MQHSNLLPSLHRNIPQSIRIFVHSACQGSHGPLKTTITPTEVTLQRCSSSWRRDSCSYHSSMLSMYPSAAASLRIRRGFPCSVTLSSLLYILYKPCSSCTHYIVSYRLDCPPYTFTRLPTLHLYETAHPTPLRDCPPYTFTRLPTLHLYETAHPTPLRDCPPYTFTRLPTLHLYETAHPTPLRD